MICSQYEQIVFCLQISFYRSGLTHPLRLSRKKHEPTVPVKAKIKIPSLDSEKGFQHPSVRPPSSPKESVRPHIKAPSSVLRQTLDFKGLAIR